MKRESKKMARIRTLRVFWRVGGAGHLWLRAGMPGPGSREWEAVRSALLDAGLIEKGPDGRERVSETWTHRRPLPAAKRSTP